MSSTSSQGVDTDDHPTWPDELVTATRRAARAGLQRKNAELYDMVSQRNRLWLSENPGAALDYDRRRAEAWERLVARLERPSLRERLARLIERPAGWLLSLAALIRGETDEGSR